MPPAPRWRKPKVVCGLWVVGGDCVCLEGLSHTPSRLCTPLTPARPSRWGQEHLYNCGGSGGLKPPNHKKATACSSELRGNMAFLYSGGREWSHKIMSSFYDGPLKKDACILMVHRLYPSSPVRWKSWQRGPCVTIFHAFNILIIR